MTIEAFEYQGTELELFSQAFNWKSYWGARVRPYLGTRVLEVGAGLGANTRLLCTSSEYKWCAIEPDKSMVEHLRSEWSEGNFPETCRIEATDVAGLDEKEVFDTIIYIDVLEHIENDAAELRSAASHLDTGGYIVVLAPAHDYLFTPFDKAVGHFRRYDKRSLSDITPPCTNIVCADYLDSAGMLASLGNRLVLRSGMPTLSQVRFWDRWLVSVSRRLDPLLGHKLGKSILFVWRKETAGETKLSPSLKAS